MPTLGVSCFSSSSFKPSIHLSLGVPLGLECLAPTLLTANTVSFWLKLGYIEFAMAGVKHSVIVNPAGQLLLTRRFS